MTNIIVAFSKPEDGKNIKSILVRNGFQVVAVCTSGGQVLSAADCLNGGIVVSGYRFEDMMYDELRQCLPGEFDMLLISSPARWSGQSPDRVICLPMPLKVHDLLNTLEMMVQAQGAQQGGAGYHNRGKDTADGTEQYDGVGSPPVYTEMQHGQRHQSGGDSPDGNQPHSCVMGKGNIYRMPVTRQDGDGNGIYKNAGNRQ